jgi:hypothetical protein
MTSVFSILQFLRVYYYLKEHYPEEKQLIDFFEDTIKSGFICFNYQDILKKYENRPEIYKLLRTCNICHATSSSISTYNLRLYSK